MFFSEYVFYIKSVSHGQVSSILTETQPLYTDVISYVITTTIENPTEITFSIRTGVGSQHKTTLVGLNSIPRLPSKVFSLNQRFVYQSLSPGKFHFKHSKCIFNFGHFFQKSSSISKITYTMNLVFSQLSSVEEHQYVDYKIEKKDFGENMVKVFVFEEDFFEKIVRRKYLNVWFKIKFSNLDLLLFRIVENLIFHGTFVCSLNTMVPTKRHSVSLAKIFESQ